MSLLLLFAGSPSGAAAAPDVPLGDARPNRRPIAPAPRRRRTEVVPPQRNPPIVTSPARAAIRVRALPTRRAASIEPVPTQPAAPAAPDYVPEAARQARRAVAVLRRRGRADVPLEQPGPLQGVSRPAQPTPSLRRSSVVEPVRAQVNPPIVIPPARAAVRVRALLARRGAVADPPSSPAELVPETARQARRAVVALRRRGRADAPAEQPGPLQGLSRPAPVSPAARRSSVVEPVPTQAAAPTPPDFVTPNTRAAVRVRALLARRGAAAEVVPAQAAAPVNPPIVIPPARAAVRVRALLARRGAAVDPPSSPAELVPETARQARRAVVALRRRGRADAPAEQPGPLQGLSRPAPVPPAARRSSIVEPVRAQVNPPIVIPPARAAVRVRALLARRGAAVDVVPAQPAPPSSTPRPDMRLGRRPRPRGAQPPAVQAAAPVAPALVHRLARAPRRVGVLARRIRGAATPFGIAISTLRERTLAGRPDIDDAAARPAHTDSASRRSPIDQAGRPARSSSGRRPGPTSAARRRSTH